MTPFDESEALNRIFQIIKMYRQQTEDYLDPISNDSVAVYLVNHLLPQDLQLWLRLEAQKSSLPLLLNDSFTTRRFKQLLGQYKRASHELIASWYQAHGLN